MTGEAPRVAGSVPSLVVLGGSRRPGPEPTAQRGEEALRLVRVALEHRPLGCVGLARLVEDLCRYRELPDVVEERGPTQPVAILERQVAAPRR